MLQWAVASLLVACGGGSESPNSLNSATLTWDPVIDPSLVGYRIYVGTASGQYMQPFGEGLDAGNVTTYTVAGLSRATRYYFVATAYDASNIESAYSNELSADIP